MTLRIIIRLAVLAIFLISTSGISYAAVPISDGFDYPVGDRDGNGPYTDLRDPTNPNPPIYNGWKVSYDVMNPGYEEHTGEDWNGMGDGSTDLYQPVYAIANGKVLYAQLDPSTDNDPSSGFGNVILIQHNLTDGNIVYSLYAHLAEINVKKDQLVSRRQEIGKLGNTGHSTGPHLHLEIRKENMNGMSATYWPATHYSGEDLKQWITNHYYDPSDHITDNNIQGGFIDDHRPQLTPLIGDWNNDGIDDNGTFDPRTSTFSIGGEEYPIENFQMGEPGDLPIVGDWNGDGFDTVGVYRPKNATFYLDNNNDGRTEPSLDPIVYGNIGDIPIAGDWNGDDYDDRCFQTFQRFRTDSILLRF